MIRRPTIQQRERVIHKVAGYVADAVWAVANKISAGATRVELLSDVVNEAGHKALNVAIRYSERHERGPHFPPLVIKKLLHQFGHIPPLTVTNQRWSLDMRAVKRVFVRKRGGLVEEQDVSITNAMEGQIDLSVVATLSVGTYDLLMEHEDSMLQILDNPIEVVSGVDRFKVADKRRED